MKNTWQKKYKHGAQLELTVESFLPPGKAFGEHSVRNEKFTFNSICKWIFGTPKENLKSL